MLHELTSMREVRFEQATAAEPTLWLLHIKEKKSTITVAQERSKRSLRALREPREHSERSPITLRELSENARECSENGPRTPESCPRTLRERPENAPRAAREADAFLFPLHTHRFDDMNPKSRLFLLFAKSSCPTLVYYSRPHYNDYTHKLPTKTLCNVKPS